MSKLNQNQFEPDYAIPPGEFLEEELESRGMSQADLAERTGLAKKTINEIIKAKAPITPDSALKFERVFRLPAHYWLNLEVLYQESLARIAERERFAENIDWLKKMPVRKMINFGWIQEYKDKPAQLNEILSFFGVASVQQWAIVWSRLQVAYRKSQTFEAHAEAISVWLRQGEIQAQDIECQKFDATTFRKVLNDIKALTCEPDPNIFMPKLIDSCSQAGVAVVLVPELPKTHVSGATRWLTKDKALIQLSLRYKSDDHLWFTFFHEAGHILKHGKKELFLEGNGMDDEKEKEANDFASNLLIPVKAFNEFVNKGRVTKLSIIHFSKELGIAPGVVVGQLQHHEWLPYTHCNDLKVRFKWVHEVK